MDTAITLKDIGMIILGVGLILLVYYVIHLLRTLILTAKSVNRILADAETISEVAARRARETDEIISDVSEAISSVSDIIKGQQSTVGAFATLINALGSLKNIFSGGKTDDKTVNNKSAESKKREKKAGISD
ncbi:MAG: hypothetical protein LBL49_09390 [Clostridiales Family XIII bacterium]|jgi:ABC-type transporter Mla subunit MlaD|nr:hypothetical protein [Clostridiales Family XIII bacterium]